MFSYNLTDIYKMKAEIIDNIPWKLEVQNTIRLVGRSYDLFKCKIHKQGEGGLEHNRCQESPSGIF